jgi:hypothetical protein
MPIEPLHDQGPGKADDCDIAHTSQVGPMAFGAGTVTVRIAVCGMINGQISIPSSNPAMFKVLDKT